MGQNDAEDSPRREESLWLTAAYNRSLIEASLDPLVAIDLEGRISDVNAATEEITGRSRAELIGTDFSSCFTDPKRADAGFRQVLEMGLARDYELEIRHEDGHITPVLYNASVYKDASGRVIGVLAAARDITERRAREVQLAESEERYRNIFENAIEGIYQSRPGLNNLIRVNPTLARMHGYATTDEMMTDFNTPGKKLFAREEDARLYRGLREQGIVRGYEAELSRKDGSTFWGSIDCRTIRDDAGKVLYYEGIVQDITERKRLEEQLQQAQKLEAIGILAGGIAHDFNNRLTVITGFGYLIEETLDSESPLMPYIKEILSSAEKAAHLTNSLLAFSRKQQINLEARSLNEIVGNTGALLRRLLPEDIDVRLGLTKETAVVMADATQIDQVLMNLATNAKDAMPKGGVLTIGTSVVRADGKRSPEGDIPPGAYAVLSVADTGTGMDEATRRRIFDPFFTTKGVGRGTGLGLSSVYGIVKQHGGHITVTSKPDEGAEFCVYLPLVESDH